MMGKNNIIINNKTDNNDDNDDNAMENFNMIHNTTRDINMIRIQNTQNIYLCRCHDPDKTSRGMFSQLKNLTIWESIWQVIGGTGNLVLAVSLALSRLVVASVQRTFRRGPFGIVFATIIILSMAGLAITMAAVGLRDLLPVEMFSKQQSALECVDGMQECWVMGVVAEPRKSQEEQEEQDSQEEDLSSQHPFFAVDNNDNNNHGEDTNNNKKNIYTKLDRESNGWYPAYLSWAKDAANSTLVDSSSLY